MSDHPSPSGKLIVSREGPITTITLNRPECHNALDIELSAELNQAVKDVNVDRDCRILVLRGAGETFCAGDDLKEFNTWTNGGRDIGMWQVRQYQETANMIDNLLPVTIAAVDGVCTGGGLELTLCCDFVIATGRSRWGMPEINWAITPGWGGTARLSKFAGRRKAKEWNLLGALFSAETAERNNLVNRLCEPQTLDAEVEGLIEVLLDKSPGSLLCTKYFVDKGADLDNASSLIFEGAPPREMLGEGVAAFVEKSTRDDRRRLVMSFWQD
jgi:enoyl-CoA hydratase/carnithine racemase